MTGLCERLRLRGVGVGEGHSREVAGQTEDLRALASAPGVKRILEIGFNAGHSSDTMLSASGSAEVVSFDIGHHECVRVAKEYLDETYPGRHTLVVGDSRSTVARYASRNPGKFDLVFVDGGHEFDVAMSDLENCARMAHGGTVVVMDDVVRDAEHAAAYTVGPTRAWDELVKRGEIEETGYKLYRSGRGQAVGRYVARPR